MTDRDARLRTALGLTAVGVALLFLPLLLNVARGGARGVGFDPRTQGSELFFAVTFPAGAAQGPLDGHLIVIVSRDSAPEPRFQVGASAPGPQIFAVEVEDWRPGHPTEVTDAAFGFPLPSLAHIPPGHYWVQGVFDRGGTSGLASVASVELLAADGEGWALRAGNLVSRPVEVYLDPRSRDVIRVDLARGVAAASGVP